MEGGLWAVGCGLRERGQRSRAAERSPEGRKQRPNAVTHSLTHSLPSASVAIDCHSLSLTVTL